MNANLQGYLQAKCQNIYFLFFIDLEVLGSHISQTFGLCGIFGLSHLSCIPIMRAPSLGGVICSSSGMHASLNAERFCQQTCRTLTL